MPGGEGRLAAIMFTDMVGYQDVAHRGESLAKYLLDRQRGIVRQVVSTYGGKDLGGNLSRGEEVGLKSWIKGSGRKPLGMLQEPEGLVLFESALEAIRCAIEIQRTLREYNREAPSDKDIYVRIGVHVGEVVEREGEVSGEAVAVASKLAPDEEHEGVFVSGQVYDQVRSKFELPMESLATKSLKNIDVPVEVYKVVMPWERETSTQSGQLDKRRIAVLPFANMSPDPNDEYFADGMTEELITTLSGVKGLTVIARTSVMRYKSQAKPISEIGRELKVGSLVEGSVRKAGDRVRITVQLVDAKKEGYLWAQSYDKKLGDIFVIQSEVAGQVASELNLKFTQTAPLPTRDVEAHQLYLKARYHWSIRSRESINTAIRYFEEAIDRDPEYSLALVGLADCYHISALFGYTSPRGVFPKARELFLRAQKAGGASAEAHSSMGEFLMNYSYDWAGAARELERALQINPNYAIAHLWRSTCYAVLGQFDNAVSEARKGEELDPFAVVAMNEVAKNYYYARKYDEAIKHFIHSLKIEPDSAYLHKGLAETYAQESMYNEATREIERALSISSRGALYLDSAACIYALSNEDRKSREVLAEADRLAANQFVPSYGRAAAYGTLGDKEKALRFLETAYDEHSWLIWLSVDPIFDSLKKEQGFHSLLRKMNLE